MKFLNIITNVNSELDSFGIREVVVHIFLCSLYKGKAFLPFLQTKHIDCLSWTIFPLTSHSTQYSFMN